MEKYSSPHNWDFDSGKLPLDFTNTVEWHASSQPTEMLENYSDLVAWSMDADLVSNDERRELLAGAERHPIKARKALQKAIDLREALFRLFTAVAFDKQPDKADINLLNQILAEAMAKIAIVSTPKGFTWTWIKDKDALDRMLWPIARSSADLLTSEDMNRVGRCEDDRGCGYLFFDTSRNRSRRWCSMESCGNRAKAQRHYQRRSQKVK